MFSLLLSKVGGWLAGIGAVLIALLAFFGMAKRAGKKEEQAEQTAQSLKQAKEANEIDKSVHADTDDALNAKLHSYEREK